MDKLKPCPFCGGEAEVFSWYIKGVANRLHYNVRCKVCGCTRRSREHRTTKKAIEAWNRREEINNILQRLDEIAEEHPYKVAGDFDTYSQYNQAWEDCISRVIYEIEKGGKE